MPNQFKKPSLVEETLQGVEGALDSNFGVKIDENPTENLKALHRLLFMNKFELEAFLNQGALLPLNHEDFERLQSKIKGLITANEDARRKQESDMEKNETNFVSPADKNTLSIAKLCKILEDPSRPQNFELNELYRKAVSRATRSDLGGGLDGMTGNEWVNRYIQGRKFHAGPWDSKAEMPAEKKRELEDLLNSGELMAETFGPDPKRVAKIKSEIQRSLNKEGFEAGENLHPIRK